MDCVECGKPNPDGNVFCGTCGAELGRTLEATARKSFRDRSAIEVEITESVVARLMKWAQWLGGVLALPIFLFGFLLGKEYLDLRSKVESAKGEIAAVAANAKSEIEPQLKNTEKELSDLSNKAQVLDAEYKDLQSHIDKYQQVNQRIEVLQKQVTAVQGEVVDLGNRTLRARKLEARGEGPTSLTLANPGCDAASAFRDGGDVAYCFKGTPPILFQLTPSGSSDPLPARHQLGIKTSQ